jgi:hypothetical protein
MPTAFDADDALVQHLPIDAVENAMFLIQFDELMNNSGNVVFFRKDNVQTYFKGRYRVIKNPIGRSTKIRLSIANHSLTFIQNSAKKNEPFLDCDAKNLHSNLERLIEITKS